MTNLIIDFPSRMKYHKHFARALGGLITRPNHLQMATGISLDEKISLLPNGYADWRNLLDKYYPSLVDP